MVNTKKSLQKETQGESLPVKNPSLLKDVAEIDVGVQEVGVQTDGLLEVVDGQPDLALGVEHAAEVAPGHGKVRPGLNGLQIASLESPRRDIGDVKEVGERGERERKNNHY